MQERGHAPRAVAHFLNRLVFCMFAEDAGLLPKDLFTRVVRATQARPELATAQLEELFAKMRSGGFFGADIIKWFNGGLFDEAPALPLERNDLKLIADTATEHDWSQIDPAIFGTLFEEALKGTRQRAALGAHYTDRDKILKIVDPVIIRPLAAEWETAHAEIRAFAGAMTKADADRRAVMERAADALKLDPAAAKAGEAARRRELTAIARARDTAYGAAKDRLEVFLARLGAFRVLDPACGSGNFLYVALQALRDLELRALVDAERLGVPAPAPRVGLNAVRGIEIEPYAAELARVTLWIGDLQWMRRNGYTAYSEPILSNLDTIENRDALLSADGREAEWPAVDVIIGNPPFLGGKKMREALGDGYVDTLWSTYDSSIPHFSDLVCYWFGKAWAAVQDGRTLKVGLVATNSIRGGASRAILDLIANRNSISEAWSDEAWTLEGAAVRVSMVCFELDPAAAQLNGVFVPRVNSDLTSAEADLTRAVRLKQNAGVCFEGGQKFGPFDIPGEIAREWLSAPLNPNGRPNSDVVRPMFNASDLVRRSSDTWVIDLESVEDQAQAALYEAPYRHAERFVQPERAKSSNERNARLWWKFHRARPELRTAMSGLTRYIATPVVSKHRVFAWLPFVVWPSNLLDAITRDDDTTFGILHSRFHELWALRMGTWLGVGNDPRYTPSTTFETFPFPEGLTPDIPADAYAAEPRAMAIAEAAADLNRLREAWLNPPDLVRIEPEVVAGYPDRVLPRDEAAAKVLKTRTLTNLYNQRPAWLAMVHQRLDAAVAAAYGWPADLADEEVLARLFALNQERAAAGR